MKISVYHIFMLIKSEILPIKENQNEIQIHRKNRTKSKPDMLGYDDLRDAGRQNLLFLATYGIIDKT